MSPRTIDVEGRRWEVSPSGWVTQYHRDEFSVQFRQAEGGDIRIARYSPLGARSPEDSLSALSERQLRELFQRSQPSWTAPETRYRR